MSFYKNTVATYESTCTKCCDKIQIGRNIKYDYGGGNWKHLVCPADVKMEATLKEHIQDVEKYTIRPDDTETPSGEDSSETSDKFIPEVHSLWELVISNF
jgi:hypothetical protein